MFARDELVSYTGIGFATGSTDGKQAVRTKWRLYRYKITATPTGSEQDTALDLPTSGFVVDAWVDVDTAEATGATKTLDVGLLSSESGGDLDGFIDGLSVAAAGLVRPRFVPTVGSNNTYLGAAATHTIGALLTATLVAGEDTTAGGDGFAMRGWHVLNGTAKSLVYKAGSNDWAEFRGSVSVLVLETP